MIYNYSMSIRLSKAEEEKFLKKMSQSTTNKSSLKEGKSKTKDSSDKFSKWISRKDRNLEKEWK